MMRDKAEVHIVVDPDEGVQGVQIIGPAHTHHEGHSAYFRIQDLIIDLDKAIRERLNRKKEEYNGAKRNGH